MEGPDPESNTVLYSESQSLAFLHVHKCGGLSLRAALLAAVPDLVDLPELPGPHHFVRELFEVLEARGTDPSEVTVVTSLCHPAHHAVSVYEFWRSPSSDAESHMRHIRMARSLDFAEFLEQVLDYDGFERAVAVDGVVPPNVHVLQREHLARDTRRFLRTHVSRLARVNVPHTNRTPHAAVQTYYDERTTELLHRSYRWTFDAGLYDREIPVDDDARGTGGASSSRLALRRIHREGRGTMPFLVSRAR